MWAFSCRSSLSKHTSLRKALLESLFHGIKMMEVLHPPLYSEVHSGPLFFPRRMLQRGRPGQPIQKLRGLKILKWLKNQVSEGKETLCKKLPVTWLLGSLPVRAGNGKVQKVSAVWAQTPWTQASAKMCVPTSSNRSRAEIHELVETQAHKSTWCSTAGYSAWASITTVTFT